MNIFLYLLYLLYFLHLSPTLKINTLNNLITILNNNIPLESIKFRNFSHIEQIDRLKITVFTPDHTT